MEGSHAPPIQVTEIPEVQNVPDNFVLDPPPEIRSKLADLKASAELGLQQAS